jgi:hypothetical protein
MWVFDVLYSEIRLVALLRMVLCIGIIYLRNCLTYFDRSVILAKLVIDN